jgi:hypothetical protein
MNLITYIVLLSILMKEPKMVDGCLILFQSVHDVIRSEKLIKSKGFDYQIIPVPSNISSECGMCIELNKSNSINICDLLNLNHINYTLYAK